VGNQCCCYRPIISLAFLPISIKIALNVPYKFANGKSYLCIRSVVLNVQCRCRHVLQFSRECQSKAARSCKQVWMCRTDWARFLSFMKSPYRCMQVSSRTWNDALLHVTHFTAQRAFTKWCSLTPPVKRREVSKTAKRLHLIMSPASLSRKKKSVRRILMVFSNVELITYNIVRVDRIN
jgi:hypothetical protein